MDNHKVILNLDGYQLLGEEYFTLRLVRIGPDEEWLSRNGGLQLLFPRAGSGKFLVGSNVHRLAPGDAFVIGGGDAHGRLSVSGRGEFVFWCFSLRLEHFYPLFAGHEIALLEAVTEDLKSARLIPASSPLARRCHQLIGDMPSRFNLDHRSQLLRVASLILSEEFRTAHQRRIGAQGVEAHTIQVFEELSADELVNLSVGELAARFGCSRRHLNRLFHHYFSFSVAALKMEMRLLKAVSLLRDHNMKVIHVAEKCGFNHLGLFNTCFKRRFGVTPGQWRRQAMSGDHQPAGLASAHSECPLRPKGLCPWNGPVEDFLPVADTASASLKSKKPEPVRSLPSPNQEITQQVIRMPEKNPEAQQTPDRSRATG